jgi:beta-RFAP synthase
MEIAAAPREHTGLGTGTQLALAVARAVAALEGSTPRASELAARTGRGRRSAIGVHGFERGGFLVDGGKAEENDGTAPLLIHHAVPEAWRFVLVTPREGEGIHGREEEDSFRSIENDSEDAAASLCRVLLLGLAPALLEADLAGFGEALYEYGARSGECFRALAGWIFASREIAACVELIRGEGIRRRARAPGRRRSSRS